MVEPRLIPLLLAFFAGSWLSNGHVIRATTALLQNASLGLILAASSLAGLVFFGLLRALDRWRRPYLAGVLMLPLWGMLQTAPVAFPQHPLIGTLVAVLFGELVKWHLYSLVLTNWGPMGAQRVLGHAVLAYELGTIVAALFPTTWLGFEALALLALYASFSLAPREAEATGHGEGEIKHGPWNRVLPWIVACGTVAGLMKVSADTGLKFALRLQDDTSGNYIAHYYLVSAVLTLGLGFMRRLRWMAPRLGCSQASFTALGASQILFAFALLAGSGSFLVFATALQRSIDKIFYQPTMQLLGSGFPSSAQEGLRRWHVVGFLGLGSVCGLVAFAGHGLLSSPQSVLWGLSLLHVLSAAGFFWVGLRLVNVTVDALDRETLRAGPVGGSRPMAMLALLSPRHFLVHALKWSNRNGVGMSALPSDLVNGLVAEPGREVVRTFYNAFSRLETLQQLALIRLAAFMDREEDREFLMTVALEQVACPRQGRRLAAHHLVKVLGKEARPLLRRARGKKSPLPSKAA